MNSINAIIKFFTEQLRDREKKRDSQRFKQYYEISKEDQRGNIAKIIDFIFWRVIVFFFTTFFIYTISINIILTTIISIIVLTVFHEVSITKRNKKREKLKNTKRRFVASQKVYNEIMNKTEEELMAYITEVLKKTDFCKIECLHSKQRQILLKAMYNGKEVMILFCIYKNEIDVEIKEIKEFICNFVEHKIKRGIIISTSDFTTDSYDFNNKISDQYMLLLLNREKFLKLLEKTGLFPTDEDIDELIENTISKKQKRWSDYKEVALANKKIKGYFILSVYLIISAYYTPYTIYYTMVAGGCIGLAIIIYLRQFLNVKSKGEDYSLDVDQLLEKIEIE